MAYLGKTKWQLSQKDSSFEVKDALIVEDIVDVSWSIPRKELTEGYPYL